MFRHRIALVWSLPLLVALSAGFALRNRQLDLLAPERSRWCFGDSASAGNSTAWTREGRPWVFGMRLRPGFAFPYAAAGLHLAPGHGTVDLRDWDSLVVEWRSRRQRSLRIQIQAIEHGFTDSTRSLTFVPFEGGLEIGPGWSRRSLALRDLAIPLWWHQLAGSAPRPHPEAWAAAQRLFLENGMETPVGTDDTVEVRVLRLEGVTWMPLAILALAALSVSILLQLVLRRRGASSPPGPGTATPVRDVELEPRRDEELRRLLEWAGARYMDPAISVETAGRETGLHHRRIPSILRGSGHVSFPSLVNSLRVEQGKRLLRGTDRTVSEIAAAVGVPNVSHFHRLFKGATGRTPLEWRADAPTFSDGI